MRTVFTKKFKKQYSQLSLKEQARFDDRLRLFCEEPTHELLSSHLLHGKWDGYYSINISGDLRAIYEVIGKKTAYFVAIESHNKLYS